jgi:RND family efflux transporter MFP subunit
MATTGPQPHDPLATLQINRDFPRRPSPGFRLMLSLLGLVVLCGLGFGGWMLAQRLGWDSRAIAAIVPDAIRNLPEVRTERAVIERGRSADAVVVATGYLESRRQAMIGARGAGRIEVIHVEEGSRVRRGEELAVLEHRDLDAAVAAARASFERAKAELAEQEVEIERTRTERDRTTRLRDRNSVTESDYDRARFAHAAAVARRDTLAAAVELSRARVTEAEQARDNLIIRAPFDGTVISKDAEVGESILPGGMGEASGRGSVVTIADLEHLEVDTDVKEDYIGRIRDGSPAEVVVDAVSDRRYNGRVRKVIPMGDRARATIKVKVAILDADERLFPNMSATVYFLPEVQEHDAPSEQPRVFCSSAAIREDNDGQFVWMVDEQNSVSRVSVTTGPSREGRTEILDGLSGGETLVVGDAPTVREGGVVRIRERL